MNSYVVFLKQTDTMVNFQNISNKVKSTQVTSFSGLVIEAE